MTERVRLQAQLDSIYAILNGYESDASSAILRSLSEILQDPDLGKRLGRAGKEHVRQHFLMPRLLRDWLRVFSGKR